MRAPLLTWRDLNKGDRVSHFDYGDGVIDCSGPVWIYISWDDPAELLTHHTAAIAPHLTLSGRLPVGDPINEGAKSNLFGRSMVTCECSPSPRTRKAGNMPTAKCRPNIGRATLLAGPALMRHEPTLTNASIAVIDIDPHQLRSGPNTAILTWTTHLAAQCEGSAPLFLVEQGDDCTWTPYTQQSFTGSDVLFVALDGPALHGDPVANAVGWATELAARHRAAGLRAANHQRWFSNALPGHELEHKFTLAGCPDLWALTTGILNEVRANRMAYWICEHGNNGGFEQWDFDNHLYEITAPEAERGYIAFIPAVDGSWIIRRKRFAADAALRNEELIEGLPLGPDPDLAALIEVRWDLKPAWGTVYRRIRYNVLLESLISGHVFSIMLDRCIDRSGRTDPLHQVEVEYVRSRTLRPVNLELLQADYENLVNFTRTFLADRGVSSREDHLSKLSWLRPAAEELPV